MSFGDFLLYMLVVSVWTVLIFVWVFALFDLFRRSDLGGWAKAIWLVVIVLLPLIGTFVYLVSRPKTDWYYTQKAEAITAERGDDTAGWRYGGGASSLSSAEQLSQLADLADRGRISDAEYQAEKARILAGERPAPASAPNTPPSSAPA
jgi:phospholipase D-like protein